MPSVNLPDTSGFHHVFVTFLDLEGVMRGKILPFRSIMAPGSVVRFSLSELYFHRPQKMEELVLFPDLETIMPIPLWPGWAWVTGDLWVAGEPFIECARTLARRCLAHEAIEQGGKVLAAVECEFALVEEAESLAVQMGRPDLRYRKTSYSISRTLHFGKFVRMITEGLTECGFEDVVVHFEAGATQIEVNWGPASPLVTADRHCFVKFYTRLVANELNIRVDYAPMAARDWTFNAAHVHFSRSGERGERTYSSKEVSRNLLLSSPYVAGLVNPVETSYKRINQSSLRNMNRHVVSDIERGGAVRITDRGTIEFRQPDAAANPYLVQVATMYGAFVMKHDLGDNHHSATGDDAGMSVAFPTSLRQSLSIMGACPQLTEFLGRPFLDAYSAFKRQRAIEYDCRPTDLDAFNCKVL
ncbi:type I glutamate--ammonia ligase [Gluconacetobacter diazotrophicus]|uniref:Uncharacterized protein n=1 Tax=Gluconacetobacter diazotrophicus TaxID=33996 RepID=A0A7W4I8S5_GLUDI|nr:hypothetical protein [Gluconacetobacter diazotrophicus]MBB2158387.1 hypothetical protein [Gluconacetobacter diazotrophicus]TWB03073.1 glutamine synthetase [Gluconacetobacter diazotrophicus]